MKTLRLISLWFVLLFILSGCKSSDSSQLAASSGTATANTATDTIQVVATVGMVADIVRNVAGNRVKLVQVCGSGIDPHLYKATRDDMSAMASADAVFYSGLMLEGRMTDTLIKMARTKPVIAVTEQLAESRLLEPADFAGHYDPHVWMDVEAWSECVAAVEAALAELAPAYHDEFHQNAIAYQQQLAELHQYGLKALASIPTDSRLLITSHDAFNYFGRAYGLEVQGVQGISTESEAGLQRVNELVDTIVARQVKAVFVESSVPRKSIQALIEGAQAKGHAVTIGGELFSDAMGKTGTYEGTYIGMLDHNITLVTRGLGGDAPANGLQGKLLIEEPPLP